MSLIEEQFVPVNACRLSRGNRDTLRKDRHGGFGLRDPRFLDLEKCLGLVWHHSLRIEPITAWLTEMAT